MELDGNHKVPRPKQSPLLTIFGRPPSASEPWGAQPESVNVRSQAPLIAQARGRRKAAASREGGSGAPYYRSVGREHFYLGSDAASCVSSGPHKRHDLLGSADLDASPVVEYQRAVDTRSHVRVCWFGRPCGSCQANILQDRVLVSNRRGNARCQRFLCRSRPDAGRARVPGASRWPHQKQGCGQHWQRT